MKTFGTLFAVLLIHWAWAAGQDGPEVRLGSTLVNTFLTVTDKDGRPVADLAPSDFVIKDNGATQRISEFSRETQVPLTLALVIDRSRSVQERLGQERAAAVHFLESILRKGVDRGLIIAFNTQVNIVHDLSDDVPSLTGQIQDLTVGGNSAVFDAVHKTAGNRFSQVTEGRKVLVLFTDGDDTASEMTLDQAIKMALRTDVIVYAIGVKGTKAGAAALLRLTQATGGRTFFLEEGQPGLGDFLAQVERELRSQYSIGYVLHRPPDGRYHKLSIKTKKRGLTVRARQGYYALPPPAPGKESAGG